MSALPQPGFDATRPFLRAAGVRAGLGPRLRTPEFRSLFRGVYLHAEVPMTPLVRAEAALLPFGGAAWASHASAARVLAMPIRTPPEEHVTVTRQRDRRTLAGLVCHLATRAEAPVAAVGGVRVSSPTRAFVEMCGLLPLVERVVMGDWLVHTGRVSHGVLRRYCLRARGPGARQAKEAIGFVRERVDSPMESRLRMLIVLAGLPEPQVNLVVGDGLDFRKYDLSYRRSRTIVEYDGRHHIERIEQWEADLERREAIDDDSWRILVVVAAGIYTDPARTLDRIHRVLLLRREPGVPRQLSDEWRRHFPGR